MYSEHHRTLLRITDDTDTVVARTGISRELYEEELAYAKKFTAHFGIAIHNKLEDTKNFAEVIFRSEYNPGFENSIQQAYQEYQARVEARTRHPVLRYLKNVISIKKY